MNEALETSKEFIRGFFPLVFIVALGISLIGFLMVDRIVVRYEHRIEKQAAIITQKNKDLTGSIRYASFLQKSYLPGRTNLKKMLTESFIFTRPRDIVSGDFFYVNETLNKKYFSVIDCTGHGVPGSLLSMIGYGLLEQAITVMNDPSTTPILDYLCLKFPEVLSQNDSPTDTDGMDMAICSIDKKSKTLSFSGAKNPLLLVRENEIIKYPGERLSIGQLSDPDQECFISQTIDVREGDMVYIFSDGMPDQFGGPEGKKFMRTNFKKLLLSIRNEPVMKQRDLIEKSLLDWMGDFPQVDDITVMGVRITKELLS